MATYNIVGYNTVANPPTFGSFWIYIRMDISDMMDRGMVRRPGLLTGDYVYLAKLRDKWVIRDSYIRIPEAADTGTQYNIGYSAAGTQIAAIVDGTDTATYADWVQGTIDPNDSIASLTADAYLQVHMNAGGPTDNGVLELLLEIVAGPDDNGI